MADKQFLSSRRAFGKPAQNQLRILDWVDPCNVAQFRDTAGCITEDATDFVVTRDNDQFSRKGSLDQVKIFQEGFAIRSGQGQGINELVKDW